MSCSRTQSSDICEARTGGPSVSSQTLYNAFNVDCRELAPGTVCLTGYRAQGDDSKYFAYCTTELPTNTCINFGQIKSICSQDIERKRILTSVKGHNSIYKCAKKKNDVKYF